RCQYGHIDAGGAEPGTDLVDVRFNAAHQGQGARGYHGDSKRASARGGDHEQLPSLPGPFSTNQLEHLVVEQPDFELTSRVLHQWRKRRVWTARARPRPAAPLL